MRSKTKTDLWSEKLLKSIYFGNRIIEWIVEVYVVYSIDIQGQIMLHIWCYFRPSCIVLIWKGIGHFHNWYQCGRCCCVEWIQLLKAETKIYQINLPINLF